METNEMGQRSVYANLTNDYMFKRIFGSEECKDILINFLNRIVGNGEIEDVTFQNTEHLGPTAEDRKHEDGWNTERYHSSYRLREDDTGELLHDKLQFIFMELARFDKKEDELENYYDKWMYLFKNMPYLTERPKIFGEKEFERLFDVAELCNFTPEQYSSYQNSQKMIYDYENTIDFARKQGREEGLAEGEAKGREEGLAEGEAKGKINVAMTMKELGLDVDLISKSTGLSIDKIQEL